MTVNCSIVETCTSTTSCGDGVVQTPNDAWTWGPADNGMEDCDDGANGDDTDGCDDTCTTIVTPTCGDGNIDTGEECDDGNTIDTDACSNACTIVVAPTCGDGNVDAGEACDDGDTDDTNECNNACELGEGAECGTNPTGCASGLCDMTQSVAVCIESDVCGNGVVEAGEACDDGNADDADGCTEACEITTCGDGVVQNPNGVWDPEACDDGNTDDADDCTNTCTLPTCWDGITQVDGLDGIAWTADDEACDDGQNGIDTDGCNDACLLTMCGDGIVQAPNGAGEWGPVDDGVETCDNGVDNSDTVVDACRTTCEPASCGDGITDTGEACDDGKNGDDSDGCTDACTITTSCGDGTVQTPNEAWVWGMNNDGIEACDEGSDNSDTVADACRTNCTMPTCGDEVTDTGEMCDDGQDGDDTDGCTDACELTMCGDGIVQAPNGTGEWGPADDGMEACDDANTDNTDGCTDTCELHNCSTNGYVYFDADGDDEYSVSGDIELADVQVQLSNGMTTTTNTDGYYEFINHACEEMTVSYINNTWFVADSSQLEESMQQSNPMEIVVPASYYDLVSDNDNFGLIALPSGSGGSWGWGGSSNNAAPTPVAAPVVAPTPAPEVAAEVVVEEVVEVPEVEVIEIVEVVIPSEDLEIVANAALRARISMIESESGVTFENVTTVEEFINQLESFNLAYSKDAAGLPVYLPEQAHSAPWIVPVNLPEFLPETGARL